MYSSGRITGNSIDDICRRTIGIRFQFEQELVSAPTIAGMGHLQQLCLKVASAVRSTCKVYSSGRMTGNSVDVLCYCTLGIRCQLEQAPVIGPTIAGTGQLRKIVSSLHHEAYKAGVTSAAVKARITLQVK